MAKQPAKSKNVATDGRPVHASNDKYELLADDTVTSWDGRKLFRIRALVAIGLHVAAGDLGGYVEKELNLSAQVSDTAWVSGSARVFGSAQVSDTARVFGSARVSGSARVFGSARVSDTARVSGSAQVSGSARVFGSARVSGSAQVSGSARVQTFNITATRTDGYTFMVAPTPDGPRIMAGCRYFTFDEAVTHWTETRGGTKLGNESLSIVAHLKCMAELNGFMEPVIDAPAAEQEA